MPVNEYSEVPDSNATVGGIDIAEGCAPGNINNAIRQVMADIAEGVVHAYPQTLDPTKQAAARANIGADKTVNYTAQTLTEPQKAQARDNIDAVAIADLPEVPVEVPLGTIMHFAADTPPGGWLVCDGTPVTALYPDLRAFLVSAGSPYGTSGGNPRLPDLRGEFVRGWDGGRGVDTGRVFGSAQGDAVQDHSHLSGVAGRATMSDSAAETARFGAVPRGPGATNIRGASGWAGDSTMGLAITSGVVANDVVTPPSGTGVKPDRYSAVSSASVAPETRPRNIALLPCIRAYASVVNVPGQADMDNILQQTQVMVDDGLQWRQVAYVPVTATAAVTLTGLDFEGETLILLSGLSPNAGTGNFLSIARSTDNGATWDTAFRYSVTADWVANSLLGTFHLRKSAGGSLYSDVKTSAANQATFDTIYQAPPTSITFSATTNALRFSWSGTGRDFVAGGYIAVLKRG